MIFRRALIAGAGAGFVLVSAAHGQPRSARRPRIGVLWHAANIEEETPYYQALLEGFRHLGYVEERTIVLEHRFPDEKPELFASMAAALVSLNPDVVVGVGSAAPYLKRATSTIPMVFMYIPEPIGAGWSRASGAPAATPPD